MEKEQRTFDGHLEQECSKSAYSIAVSIINGTTNSFSDQREGKKKQQAHKKHT